jgi:hypothetical protein
MTVQTGQARGRIDGRRRVLAALLALVILIPLGVLFLVHNRYQGESRSTATQERHGIEYLLALGQLTIALTDAQSAAVAGEPVSREVLDAALGEVADVDARLGEELRVRERWTQLRDAIELAAGTDHATGRAAYTAYGEAAGLLLGLHDRVRETSGLVRDPDEDAHHVQDAAGGRLPEAVVAAGRLVDLVILTTGGATGGATGGPTGEAASGQPADPSEISIALAAVTGPAGDLVASVQAALDSTESRSLSSAVLGKYDRFLRAKDGLLLAVPADGNLEAVDFGQLAFAQGEIQAAGDDLSTTLLTELDTLVQTRLSGLTRSMWIAIVAVLVGVLLVAGLVAVALVQRTRPPTRHRHQGELPAGSGGDGLGGGSGADHMSQLYTPLMPISDTAADYEPRPGSRPGGNRFAGELLDPERADVR